MVNSFDVLHSLLHRIETAFELINVDQDKSFVDTILQIGLDIQEVCGSSADAMLGSIQLVDGIPHGVEHALHNALLCEVSCRRMQKDPLDRLPTILAALTHDIGMYDVQQEFFEQKEELSAIQKHIINTHPQQGYDLLRAKGVTNQRWLEAVVHHHERVDGSGYPHGITADIISFDAKLLAFTDNYTALTQPRAHRDRILHKDVLKQMLLLRGNLIDADLASLFIHAIGIYAPGSIVKLEGGSIGLVTALSKKINMPEVMLLTDSRGTPLTKSKKINTYESNISIVSMLNPDEYHDLIKSAGVIWKIERPLFYK